MRSDPDITFKEKIELLKDLLKRPDEIKGRTEGSKVIILTVMPEEETDAIEELNKTFDDRITYIDTSEILLKVADKYDLENLKYDRNFYGKDYKESFLRLLLDSINKEITEKSSEKTVAIHRIGILNGLIRLNQIIESITETLKYPLIVVYPGNRKNDSLNFLNNRHVTSIYRAEII